MNFVNNKYIDSYINYYVKPFRDSFPGKYAVSIGGLADFIVEGDNDVSIILHRLQAYGFEVQISKGSDTIDEVQVEYLVEGSGFHELFEYRIENLISTIFLSSKTDISIAGILIMQIISRLICKLKIMYKAIILDLDDTVWKGTLAEDGIDAIKLNFCSSEAVPHVTFMRFVRVMAKELGLYVAICSRNSIEKVKFAIDKLNEKEFPLKGQIDCIVANYNDKSDNIKTIARQLSILTNACVFIDDNQLIRDEVRHKLPEVFVPEWKSHDELITLLVASCVFDRFELSLKSKNRKRLYKVLQQERERCYLPQLFVKVSYDTKHIEANRLYAKSNQFRFSGVRGIGEDCKSIVFEIVRDNGENLGICSAVTYSESEQEVYVLNWAISCRYFEIGLEEYILMYIFALSKGRLITFAFEDTGFNEKAIELIHKYASVFLEEMGNRIRFSVNEQLIKEIQSNTNLKEYWNE